MSKIECIVATVSPTLLGRTVIAADSESAADAKGGVESGVLTGAADPETQKNLVAAS
jgi:hypothetical protein